jgi:hypothetical protein
MTRNTLVSFVAALGGSEVANGSNGGRVGSCWSAHRVSMLRTDLSRTCS